MVMRILWLLLFLIINFVHAKQQSEELFLLGNKAYQEQDFQKALEFYQSIENKSEAIWYNIGNALYHLNDDQQALIAWLRAQKQAISSLIYTMAEYNKNVVRKKHEIKSDNFSLWFAIRQKLFVNSLGIPLLFLQLFFLIIWYIVIGAGYMLHKRHRLSLIGLVVLLIVMGIILALGYEYDIEQKALIKQETFLYAGIGAHCTKKGRLQPGQEVIIKQQVHNWTKVKSNNDFGWVSINGLELI